MKKKQIYDYTYTFNVRIKFYEKKYHCRVHRIPGLTIHIIALVLLRKMDIYHS